MLTNKCFLVFGLMVVLHSACTVAGVEEEIENPITEIVSYESDIKNIMTANCISCHGGNFPIAGIGLETYEDVRFYTENQNLANRIKNISSPMPPSGLMTAQEISLVEKWIQDGYLQY